MEYRKELSFAKQLDAEDALRHFRQLFYIPKKDGREVVYFCGNSLGLQPKTAKSYLEQELQNWAQLGVEAHFSGKHPWYYYQHLFPSSIARLLGTQPSEVVIMNTLTVNLHLMMISFYRPTKQRYKVMMEANAFPSDRYAVESQVKLHGFDPEDAIIEVLPREGEDTLQTEDILATIEANKDTLALIMMGGVNYYSGQAFDMKAITWAGHQVGAIVGFDLAHAIGNILLELHAWDVDFAVWCSYKYLNSGPGAPGGIFVHERHGNNPLLPRLAGWWGYDEEKRFQNTKGFVPQIGAAGWQLSNAPVLPMAVHKAALDIFDEAGMSALRKKSEQLTGYLQFLLGMINQRNKVFDILTPSDPAQRGCQLSLRMYQGGKKIHDTLLAAGIICDWREPDVIRLAPTPLYNTFEEVYRVAELLDKLLT